MTDLKQKILIIKGKLAEKAGLDPYLYNELSSDLSEILQLIEDNYIPKERGKCGDCKHHVQYTDYKMKCSYYGSMPRSAFSDSLCIVDNKTFWGFKKKDDFERVK